MDAHVGHRRRLWARFLEQGLAGFLQPYEKLEFLLTFVTPRKDTKPLAKALLARFGSLAAVTAAEPARLMDIEGVGPRTAGFLRVLGETAAALAEERLATGDLLEDPARVKSYLIREVGCEESEFFLVLFLTNQNRLARKLRLFRGTHNQISVYPRELAKEALACNAAAAIVAHNHPSGLAEPSPADVSLTRKLARTLETVGVSLHDHLVVTRDEVVSLRERGLYRPVKVKV